MALNGKTPAEKCGIIIEGQDKWKTVIENASKTANQSYPTPAKDNG
jgi:hypothetical protein